MNALRTAMRVLAVVVGGIVGFVIWVIIIAIGSQIPVVLILLPVDSVWSGLFAGIVGGMAGWYLTDP